MRFFGTLMAIFVFSICPLKGFPEKPSIFENSYNSFTEDRIFEISVISERNSGTNYLKRFLECNFPNIKMCKNIEYENNEYAHKHFFPWFNLAEFGFTNFRPSAAFPSLERSKHCLFVFIIRNPHDWVRSFYHKSYHVDPSLTNKDLLHFMSSPWQVEDHPLVEPDKWNPYNERPFKNVLELRKFKTLNYLEIGRIVNNFVLIPYEKLIQAPLEFIEFLTSSFNLDTPLMINPEADFIKTTYAPFTEEEKAFFLEEVDWEVESLVGYGP